MKAKTIKIALFLALILLPLGAAKALDTKTGNAIYVAKDEIVSGNLYAAGNTITIDGTVSGDLITAAQTITVNGRIDGDVIAAAQNININGEVGGNVRVAGNSISLNGTVARNVNAFGSNVVIGSAAKIGWDIYAAGSSLEMRGLVEGSFSGQAAQALVSGKVGKDVDLKLAAGGLNQELIISPETVINGDLTYTSKNAAKISEKSSIAGQVEQTLPTAKETNWLLAWVWAKLFSIFAAIVIGLVLVFLLKNLTPKILEKIDEKPIKMLVPGLVLMFIIPPIALVLCFTLIGIPLALILMAWWLVATYVARIIAAILVGQLIFKQIFKKSDVHLAWPMIVGIIVCWLLFAIPFIGWIMMLIAIWLGLGGIFTFASQQLKNL